MSAPTANPPSSPPSTSAGVDVRGQRFGATLTTVLLATALVVQGPVGVVLLAIQVAVFAMAVVGGVTRSPWAALFRRVRRIVAPGPPSALEDPGPPRFAQACGLLVAGAGLVAVAAGAATSGWVLVGVVLVLSTLLAATGLCIGCELYVVLLRLRGEGLPSPWGRR